METSSADRTEPVTSTLAGEQGLAGLIAGLEKAEGPSGSLDHMIAEELGWTFMEAWALSEAYWVDAEGNRATVPFWTASIDAALTLLPETFTTTVHSDRAETFPVVCDTRQFSDGHEATVYYDPHPTWNVERQLLAEGYSERSLALALCIAALKARQSRTEER